MLLHRYWAICAVITSTSSAVHLGGTTHSSPETHKEGASSVQAILLSSLPHIIPAFLAFGLLCLKAADAVGILHPLVIGEVVLYNVCSG